MTDPDSKIIANVRREIGKMTTWTFFSDAAIRAVIKAATTPVDPDEEWRKAAYAYDAAFRNAAMGTEHSARIIAGLRAAWHHMPLTKEALGLLRRVNRQGTHPFDPDIIAFLFRIEGDQK